ncbi:MAG: class I SAM-dependent methyltransferase [Acidobacteriota bacterium]
MAIDSSTQHKEAVIEHFDCLSSTGHWSHLYEVKDGLTYHFHVRRQRVLELLPRRLGRVADVGCGPGVMVQYVLERGGTFEGVDLSPEMIREAKEKYTHLEGVSFQEGSIEELKLPSAAYDQVICMAVIEYLKTPDRALAEIARIMRPDAIAVITVPKRVHIDKLMINITTPFRALFRALGAEGADTLPRLCLQPDELDEAAKRAGLIFERGAQYCFTPIPYPFSRVAPKLSMRLNLPFEKWYTSRKFFNSFFAHGYIGLYRKP